MVLKYRQLPANLLHALVMVIAFGTVICFAIWWFYPSHIPTNFIEGMHVIDIIIFLLVSYIIWHPILMEVLTWAISSKIKPLSPLNPAVGLKVAFITTIVPASESVDLLHKILPAMVNAQYPHDTWLLDEGNNPEVKKICYQYGVKHFSRQGVERLNTRVGKFTKTGTGSQNG